MILVSMRLRLVVSGKIFHEVYFHKKKKMLGVLFLVFSQSYIEHDLRKNKIVVTSITGFFRYYHQI
jgi:hypothetical protein